MKHQSRSFNNDRNHYPADHDQWLTVLAYLIKIGKGNLGKKRTFVQRMGKKASKICRNKKITPKKVNHELYYQINAYPLWILDEISLSFDELSS